MVKTLKDHFAETRHHATNAAYKAQSKNFIRNEFISYGLETHLHTFSTKLQTVNGTNVIGVLKGKYFKTPHDKIVGVGAHYDTMRNTPGVNDNGAAVVVMLEAAKNLSKYSRNYTVVFVAFDFEEWEEGNVSQAACLSISCGSESFMNEWVKSYWDPAPDVSGVIVMDTIMNFQETDNTQTIPPGFDQLFPNVVANINADGNDGDFLAAIGRPYDSLLLNTFVNTYNALGQPEFEMEKMNLPLPGQYVSTTEFSKFQALMRSDHYSFWKNGLAAIFLTDTADFRGYMRACYHQPCDDMSRVTNKLIQFAAKIAKALIGTVDELAPPLTEQPYPIAGAEMPGISGCLLGMLMLLEKILR